MRFSELFAFFVYLAFALLGFFFLASKLPFSCVVSCELLIIAFLLLLAALFYFHPSLPDPNLSIQWVEIRLSRLNRRVRMVHLSDIHDESPECNRTAPFTPPEILHCVLQTILEVKPDLVLITGGWFILGVLASFPVCYFSLLFC